SWRIPRSHGVTFTPIFSNSIGPISFRRRLTAPSSPRCSRQRRSSTRAPARRSPSRTRRSATRETDVKRIFRIGEDRHELLVLPHRSGRRLRIDGHERVASLHAFGTGEYRVEVDGVAHRAWIAVRGDAIHVHLAGRSWTLESIDELAETAAHGGGASDT